MVALVQTWVVPAILIVLLVMAMLVKAVQIVIMLVISSAVCS